MSALGSLGLIPSWQFSANPAVNPGINPYVGPPTWQQAPAYRCDDGTLGCGPGYGMIHGGFQNPGGLGYVMVDPSRSYRAPRATAGAQPAPALSGITDLFTAGGWIYDNRTAIFWSGVGLVGLGLAVWLIR